MYGPPTDAEIKALSDKALVAALVGVASDDFDTTAETVAYHTEILRRLNVGGCESCRAAREGVNRVNAALRNNFRGYGGPNDPDPGE